MAGHSKWANIKHRKGAQDAKRSKIFTRIIKDLTIASKEGGIDPETNPRLRTAIANAKGANMPKDTIERAIKKGSDEEESYYQEVSFEGYGPHGVAIFIECTTDNNNRTVANIRAIFNKHGGSLGTNGSLEFLFERKGMFIISNDSVSLEAEDLEMGLIDCGLEEFILEKNTSTIYCDYQDFNSIQTKLESLNISILSAELQRIASDTKILDLEKSKSILNLINTFDDDDDVKHVFHNLDISNELIKKLEE